MERLTGNPTFVDVYAFLKDPEGFAEFAVALKAGAIRLGKRPSGQHVATIADRRAGMESDWLWDEELQDFRVDQTRPIACPN